MASLPSGLKVDATAQSGKIVRTDHADLGEQTVRAIAQRMQNGDVLVIGRNVDEASEISHVVGQALALGLLPALCLCLLAGAWLSVRAEKRVEEVNQRVQRIIAGDLKERLPHRNVDEPFSKLAIIVNGMLDEMETMINALAGVGNDIAHDLRKPLTRARLALERGRANATSLEQLQAATDKAITGIDQSLTIITALLRLAEIENSRRSAGFSNVPLHEMLREVCDIYEPIAENKNIALRVHIDQDLNVRGDRDLLVEAVANLVDNAIKFTPDGGRVDMGLLRDDGRTIVRVTDTGPGISEEEREAVLRRFYRSDKMRNTPGVGTRSQPRGSYRQAARLQACHSSGPRRPAGDYLSRFLIGRVCRRTSRRRLPSLHAGLSADGLFRAGDRARATPKPWRQPTAGSTAGCASG